MTSINARLVTALADRYRIERELGQGGMATVYLAHDIKHDRKVAVKVLRPELAAVIGADRFLSEIKTTANLQHPHILALHDSGSADGFLFYVMPLIDGVTLRDRITREHQLPVDDAVRIAREVAGALDYAHRHGVIHRDIKPENILLHDGTALVADFGIALAASTAGTRMTETGMSLGTPTYMSPEQAMGERVLDARTDIYALGCVTYEMLVGDPPFLGSTAQAIVAKVMTEKPAPPSRARDTIPIAVEDAVLTALEKLPADRFASAADFAAALKGGGTAAVGRGSRRDALTTTSWARDPRSRIALGALLLLFVLAITLRLRRAPVAGSEEQPPMLGRLSLAPGERVAASKLDLVANAQRPSRTAFAFSPDGKAVVFVGTRDSVPQLFLRALAAETATPIPGTEGAESPFFAPDGRSIGYWANGKLMRVPPSGGLPTEITTITRIAGASWTEDDRIVVGAQFAGLVMLSATGTAPPDTIAADGWFPQFLPGGKALLLTTRSQTSASGFRIELLTMATKTRATVIEDGSDARYVPTGHLIFARNGGMLAAPFDVRRLKLTASPAIVLPEVMVAVNGNNIGSQTGAMQVAISPLGHLLYLTGGPTPDRSRQLVSIDRSGRETPIIEAGTRPFFAVRLSPDESHVAVTLVGLVTALYVFDLARKDGQMITDPGRQLWPLWSRDGKRILRSGLAGDSSAMVSGPADGSRKAESLVPGKLVQGGPAFWSTDGTELFTQRSTTSGLQAVALADGATRKIENTPDSATAFDLSPDGKWIVYGAPEAGGSGNQIFVQPWPKLDRKWKISTTGGTAPHWTRNGQEIVYSRGVGTDSLGQPISQMIGVTVTLSPDFSSQPPHPLFTAAFGNTTPLRSYDVTADGSRFFVITGSRAHAPPGELRLLFNWFSTLRELTATMGTQK
jgi:Tol biopolymer transport system component/tRNA A-37 threonylcarbamoyl transferase component Bud32